MNPYGGIFIFFIGGFLIVYLTMAVVKIVSPDRPSKEKLSSYECGETPIGSGWINFNARFYLIAILFIIFDVELILVFPVAVNFREYVLEGHGIAAFIEIFLFVGILFMGLVYAWKNGYLDWLRTVRRQIRVEGHVIRVKDLIPGD